MNKVLFELITTELPDTQEFYLSIIRATDFDNNLFIPPNKWAVVTYIKIGKITADKLFHEMGVRREVMESSKFKARNAAHNEDGTHVIEMANGITIISDSLADLKHMRSISSSFTYRLAKLVLWVNAKELSIIKNTDRLTITDNPEL